MSAELLKQLRDSLAYEKAKNKERRDKRAKYLRQYRWWRDCGMISREFYARLRAGEFRR